MGVAEDDRLALWMIAQDVEEQLGINDPLENLEITLGLVKELIKRGLRAGDSPVGNNGVYFKAWPDQDPEVIVEFIRREWTERAALPGWAMAMVCRRA